MTIDERTRHQLYLRLEAVLGHEEATTLMEHLPPVGWADVATKTDLAALEQRMDLRFESLEERMESRLGSIDEHLGFRLDGLEHRLRAEFQRVLRTTMLAVMVGNAAIVSIVAALANLF